MKRNHIIWITFLLCTIACNNHLPNHNTQTLNYKTFAITVPKQWKRVDEKGIDSFVGEIHIDPATSIGFDMGWYCSDLDEDNRTTYYMVEDSNVYVPDSSAKQDLKEPSKWKYFGKADSATIEKLKRQKITWINIDGYKAKLVTPKKAGIGITGVYIDSLWKSGDGKTGFVLNGYNLTKPQQEQLITAIQSLKFNRPISD